MITARDHTATIGNLSLHYLDWGTAGRPPLLCLHGITQTAHSWDEVAPVLARTHHVRVLDQRGHGDSTWAPDGDYRITTQNHDIERFLRTIDAVPAVLVALSMGGLVALTLAARAPELVRALVVVDIAPEVKRGGVDNIRNFVAATDELDQFEEFVARAHAFNPRPRSRTFANACATT
jgi:non-heme chloroperoxidase